MKKFLRGCLLTICVLVLFCSTFVLLLLIPMSNGIEKKNVKKMIEALQIEKMSKESDQFKTAIDEMLDPIYEETRKIGIDDEIVLKIIDSKEVKQLTADVTSNLLDYLLTGKNQPLVSEDDLKSLAESAIERINKDTDFTVTDEQKEEILNLMEENSEFYEEFIPETSSIEDELTDENKQALQLFRFFFSTKLRVYFLIAFLLSLIGIILLKRKEFKFLKCCAITVMVASIIALLCLGFMWVISLALFQLDFPYIFKVIDIILKQSLTLSGAMFIATILLLIIYKIITKKEKVEPVNTEKVEPAKTKKAQ